MDAISFLLKEHERVRRNFSIINQKNFKSFSARKAKLRLLFQALIIHEKVEQKIWYTHFKNTRKLKKEVRHLINEENHAANVIKSFDEGKTEREWEAQFKKIKQAVEHHAAEEENSLFPYVKEIFDKNELEVIGKKMRLFKRKLKHKKIH